MMKTLDRQTNFAHQLDWDIFPEQENNEEYFDGKFRHETYQDSNRELFVNQRINETRAQTTIHSQENSEIHN